MTARKKASVGSIIKIGPWEHHVTSTQGGRVYGHSIEFCGPTCSDEAEEVYLDDDQRDGEPIGHPKEVSKLLTGPDSLFRAMRERAADLGISSAEAWRDAARAWLDH